MKLFQEKRRVFPDPEGQSIDGIVAMGDLLNVSTLFEAYSFGIFPWPHEGLPLLWYSPDPRGVIDFSEIKIGKSLRKFLRNETDYYLTDSQNPLKKPKYTVTFNTAFKEVMQKCSEVERPGQGGTWIYDPMKKAYLEFHKAGYAHSIEVWRDKKLVGGLYGVYVAGVFSGESMFYLESNTSKLALLTLIERLKANGLTWIDIQMVTPVTESLGGRYLPRAEFMKRLALAKVVAQPLRL